MNLRRFLAPAVAICVAAAPAFAQTLISRWDFNSTPISFNATIGAGTMTLIGGTTFTLNTGSPNDTGIPNNAPNTTTYPVQGTASGTAGVEFSFSTAGFEDVIFQFDQRHSNTSSRFVQAFYSTNGGLTYIPGPVYSTPGGDTWNFDRTVDFTAIPAADNNASMRVRVVSIFDPGSAPPGSYSASRGTSTYGTASTLRMDFVRITGTSVITTPPSGAGFFAPAAVCRDGETVLTVTVQPGTIPVTTSHIVTADFTGFIASPGVVTLTEITPNTFTATVTLSGTAPTGFGQIPVTVRDATNASRFSVSQASIAVADCSFNSAAQVVIKSVYGGGGNTGAVLNSDFIEIYNRSCTAVNIDGWSLQYTGAGANNLFDGSRQVNLSGMIMPGQTLLIQCERPGAMTPGLPFLNTADFFAYPINPNDTPVAPQTANGFSMGNSSGRLALANTTSFLGSGCSNPAIVDFVGYGTTASCFEGVASVAAPSNTTMAVRKSLGCQDSNQNFNDFEVVFVNDPLNSQSPFQTCSTCTNVCFVDFNADGFLTQEDLGGFLTAFLDESLPPGPSGTNSAPCPGQPAPYATLGYAADYNRDCTANQEDLSGYITDYFGETENPTACIPG